MRERIEKKKISCITASCSYYVKFKNAILDRQGESVSALQGVSRFFMHICQMIIRAEFMCVCLQSGLLFYHIHLKTQDDFSSVTSRSYHPHISHRT